jgi:RNA polymerase sigma-70 factor (ECF subfamily)
MGNQTLSLETEMEPSDNSHHANPEEQVIQQDRIRLVRQLIDQLPEKQRSCMQLRDIEGKSYKDIATILQITEEQVKINIFRARQTIREQFKKADS